MHGKRAGGAGLRTYRPGRVRRGAITFSTVSRVTFGLLSEETAFTARDRHAFSHVEANRANFHRIRPSSRVRTIIYLFRMRLNFRHSHARRSDKMFKLVLTRVSTGVKIIESR